jgi:hypothetical protein
MPCSSGFLPVLSTVDEYGIISDEVPVAQWIERVPPEHETAGSSPVGDAFYEHVIVGLSPPSCVKSRSPLPNPLLHYTCLPRPHAMV